MARFSWRWGSLVLLLTISAWVAAQVPTGNPIVKASQAIGESGLSKAAAPATSPLSFKPGPRKFLKTYVASMFEDVSEQQTMAGAIGAVMDSYEEALKADKFANDGAQSLGFAVAILHTLATGKEADDASFAALSERFRATFDTPAIRQASNAAKQEFYEWTLCTVGLVAVISTQATTADQKAKIAQLADAQLQTLIGVGASSITLDGKNVSIKTKATVAPPATGDGLAPGLTFTMPEGWEQRSGWYIRSYKDRPTDTEISSALVRFPPAIPAKGIFSDAIRAAWDKYIPAEGKGKGSGMVYRRYVGDGLVSQFIFGRVRENGQKADTLFSVYMIDCGSTWQPMIVAYTYVDNGDFAAGVDFSASFSYPKSADVGEQFIRTLRCPAAKGKPLVDTASLVGDYNYGTGSSLMWENIYTGASSMTFVSYGGTLNLKANGTFTYTFSSASGQVGATRFGSAKGAGKWSIVGDILVCKYSSYDQGDSYKRTEEKYRIAGVVSFSDGSKVIVLKSKLDLPINACTVNDSSDYYSTKKK